MEGRNREGMANVKWEAKRKERSGGSGRHEK